jgi:hypothetical protein
MEFSVMVMILWYPKPSNSWGNSMDSPPPDSGCICSGLVFQNPEENVLTQITQDYYLESVVTAFHFMVK